MPDYKFKVKDIIKIDKILPDSFDEFRLKQCFIFTDNAMKLLGIDKFVPTDSEDHKNIKEVWAFAVFDRTDIHKEFTKEKRYIVSSFGRVYNTKSKKMISQSDSSGYSTTASGEHYKKVNIHIYDEYTIYYIHRLVATTFIKKPNKNYDIVNHIDEHPYNNYLWNLEWTDKSGNANMHNAWVRSSGTCTSDKKTWTIDEIKDICYLIADGHKATYIYNTLYEKYPNNPMITYERIRTMYKHIMKRGDFHQIALDCGVHFDNSGKPNYSKEKGSVEKIKKLKEGLNNT